MPYHKSKDYKLNSVNYYLVEDTCLFTNPL